MVERVSIRQSDYLTAKPVKYQYRECRMFRSPADPLLPSPLFIYSMIDYYYYYYICRIAFVTFKEAESAQMALDAPEHKLVLDGR